MTVATTYATTDNLGLDLYGDNDPADLRDGYNSSMRKIDSAVKSNTDAIVLKADKATTYTKDETNGLLAAKADKTTTSKTLKNTTLFLNNTNLSLGDICETVGFHDAEDGGGATYEIVAKNPAIEDGIVGFNVSDSLTARLITQSLGSVLDVRKLGAKAEPGFDNSSILDKAISIGNIPLYFHSGTFETSKPMTFNDGMRLIVNRGAEIKATTSMPYLIGLNVSETNPHPSWTMNDSISGGGTLNGNHLADTIIALSWSVNTVISHLWIKNFVRNGINTRYMGNSGGNIKIMNVTIQEENPTVGAKTYAIFDHGADNYVDQVDVIDTTVAISSAANSVYSSVHAWVSSPSYVAGSTFAELHGGSMFRNCVMDTLQNGFMRAPDLGPTGNLLVNLIGCQAIWAAEVWGSLTLPVTFFDLNAIDEWVITNFVSWATIPNVTVYASEAGASLTRFNNCIFNLFGPNSIDYSKHIAHLDDAQSIGINSIFNDATQLPDGVTQSIVEVYGHPDAVWQRITAIAPENKQGNVYTRGKISGTWTAWKAISHV